MLFLNDILHHCTLVQGLRISLSQKPEGVLTVTKCNSVTALFLSGHSNIVFDVIMLCPNLQKLSFSPHLIAGPELVAIAETHRQLRFLGLCGVNLSIHVYNAITSLCSEIVNLDLSTTRITDSVIECTAVNLNHLRRLNIRWCHLITNAALHSLAVHRASTLQVLWFRENIRITPDAVLTLKSKLPALYVHWQMQVDVPINMESNMPEYSLCTSLILPGLVGKDFAIVKQCKLLTILCLYDMSSCLNGLDPATMTELVHCCPLLHTIVVDEWKLSTLKASLNSIGSNFTTTSNIACFSVDLHEFLV